MSTVDLVSRQPPCRTTSRPSRPPTRTSRRKTPHSTLFSSKARFYFFLASQLMWHELAAWKYKESRNDQPNHQLPKLTEGKIWRSGDLLPAWGNLCKHQRRIAFHSRIEPADAVLGGRFVSGARPNNRWLTRPNGRQRINGKVGAHVHHRVHTLRTNRRQCGSPSGYFRPMAKNAHHVDRECFCHPGSTEDRLHRGGGRF